MKEASLWRAVVNREQRHDGKFYYGVTTTGIYCRPSCPSRRPLRENVRFYESAEAAELDGLRPCLRCHPKDSDAQPPMRRQVDDLCRYIEAHADTRLTLDEMSKRVKVSPHHLHRSFKAIMGLTPRQYVEACRVRSLKSALRNGRTATAAIYEAGFTSSSRVYERADAGLGMTPRQYRRGGEGVEISYAVSATPLGLLLIGATGRGLCFVQFGSDEGALRQQLEREYSRADLRPMLERSDEFDRWMRALVDYLNGSARKLELRAEMQGTAFQVRVWHYLQSIPYGTVQSYTEVARGIGRPTAVRAVAGACAANRLALLVPCHRVIRGDGGLGGYRWGLQRKRTLIDLERANR